MAIRKSRIDRNAPSVVQAKSQVVDLPAPWKFVIDCPHHGEVTVDFDVIKGRGRDALAAAFKDAAWQLRHSRVSVSIEGYRNNIVAFFRFLEETESPATKLEHMSRALLGEYVRWLGEQTRVQGKNTGKVWTLGAQMTHYRCVVVLLKHLRRRYPERTRQLDFPLNPFPGAAQVMEKRPSYSVAESERIVRALNLDLRALHGGVQRFTEVRILALHMIVLGMATGRNLQCLIELSRTSLEPHPAPGRVLLTTTKRRGYSEHATPYKASKSKGATDPRDVAIPETVAGHIEWLAKHTESLAAEAGAKFAERIFLYRPDQGPNKGDVVPVTSQTVYCALQDFVRRHELKDDYGDRLLLNISRLRPTFANAIYVRTGGDLRAVQKALNHVELATTVRNYLDLPPDAHRNHALVVEGMVAWTKQEVEGKTLLAADGRIPIRDVANLLSGGYNTGVARCKNPFRDNDRVCTKFFTCFRCQNMVVFEDDLWRLFSFYYRLLDDRSKIAPNHWVQTYGPIIKRIDNDIAPQFPIAVVAAARKEAKRNPHPMWQPVSKDPLT